MSLPSSPVPPNTAMVDIIHVVLVLAPFAELFNENDVANANKENVNSNCRSNAILDVFFLILFLRRVMDDK